MNKTKMILAGTGGAIGLVVLVLAFLVWQAFSAKTAAIEGDDEEGATFDAGADLVQLYTGYVYNGPGMVKAVCRELIAAAEKPAAMRAAGESVQNGENPEASAPEAVGTAGKASDGESEEERRPGSGQK